MSSQPVRRQSVLNLRTTGKSPKQTLLKFRKLPTEYPGVFIFVGSVGNGKSAYAQRAQRKIKTNND